MKETKITALYERTPAKNRLLEERFSINTQKNQLEDYATAHGFENIVHFTDDGISSVLFGADRPGFSRMMSEIESGNVGICLCRDLSRLGRGHYHVGLCIESMRTNGVRLIAINDDLDSDKNEDDFAILSGILHKFYAIGTRSK